MTPRTILTGLATAALLAGPAVAQDATTGGEMTAPPAPAFTSIEEMTVGDVVGMNTVGPDGASIGKIDQVVGQPGGAAAVVGIGGFLGIGEHDVALPLEDFELNGDGSAFVLATDRETLEAQPEFDDATAESLPSETPVSELLQGGEGSGDAITQPEDTGTGTTQTE